MRTYNQIKEAVGENKPPLFELFHIRNFLIENIRCRKTLHNIKEGYKKDTQVLLQIYKLLIQKDNKK